MKKYAFPLAALLLAACNSGEEITTTQTNEPVARILEYTPAPGQFINEEARSGGAFDNVDTPEKACRYAAARFAENNWVFARRMGRIPRRGIRRAGTQHGRLRPLRQGATP